MQLGARVADLECEPPDRFPVRSGQPGCGPDADALAQGGDDFDLFATGEDVHSGQP